MLTSGGPSVYNSCSTVWAEKKRHNDTNTDTSSIVDKKTFILNIVGLSDHRKIGNEFKWLDIFCK